MAELTYVTPLSELCYSAMFKICNLKMKKKAHFTCQRFFYLLFLLNLWHTLEIYSSYALVQIKKFACLDRMNHLIALINYQVAVKLIRLMVSSPHAFRCS